jgi:hypothetical protein
VTLQVVHVDLYFFYGVDIVLLNVEVRPTTCPVAGAGAHVPLRPRLSGRLGRRGQPSLPGRRRVARREGDVLARSDAQQRDAFLAHLAEHRAPRISEHWEYVLAPLVNHHSARGRLRFARSSTTACR